MESIMVKRTSIKREKLPALVERYLQLLEKKVPPSLWHEILAQGVVFDGGRGKSIVGYDAVSEQIKTWHEVIDRIEIQMLRMIDYPGESSDKRGGRTVKVDFVAKGIWTATPAAVGVGVALPVIAMYEIRDGLVEEIREAWPRSRIPPTVG
jgi:hypothetical protein